MYLHNFSQSHIHIILQDQYVFLHQVVSVYLIRKEFFCSSSALPYKLADYEAANNTYSNTATAVIGAVFDVSSSPI